ncbi:SAM-dependent methyltransferase [Ancylothrix sp. C2]|uniref:SAM-dependent methyltransferase n=1 Tax=Ancylothrix sp. D3o TaxID=2953691 RepID=UPI0021BB3BC9|nr:SAM-dependent methyltransferase [Ancylothrix sp. D3o]MCT7951625.1 SAM-dependent methyltransferase [Ancylothrix sp. D3o]
MGLQLQNVIPWGRRLEEYLRMFDLSSADRQLSILDCAGGPASFNCERTRLGYRVISCDPIYQFSTAEIAQRIEETYPTVIEGVEANKENYVWKDVKSPAHLGEIRMMAMRQFLEDLPVGIEQGRYIPAELPVLPFNNQQFDLALCGHFLFSYSDFFSQEFHIASILELCRVAAEVRIFPLLKINNEPSPMVEPAMQELKARGYQVEKRFVPYEFQKNGNQMLVCRPA